MKANTKPTNKYRWAPTTEGYTSRNYLSWFTKHDKLRFEIIQKLHTKSTHKYPTRKFANISKSDS